MIPSLFGGSFLFLFAVTWTSFVGLSFVEPCLDSLCSLPEYVPFKFTFLISACLVSLCVPCTWVPHFLFFCAILHRVTLACKIENIRAGSGSKSMARPMEVCVCNLHQTCCGRCYDIRSEGQTVLLKWFHLVFDKPRIIIHIFTFSNDRPVEYLTSILGQLSQKHTIPPSL